MMFGPWRQFAIEYNVDFNDSGGRIGLVGSFTYWINSIRYGLVGPSVARFGNDIYDMESKLDALDDPAARRSRPSRPKKAARRAERVPPGL